MQQQQSGPAFRWYHPTKNSRIDHIEIKEPDYTVQPTVLTEDYKNVVKEALHSSSDQFSQTTTQLNSLKLENEYFNPDSNNSNSISTDQKSSGFDYNLNSDFFDEEPLILENDKWNFGFSRKTPIYIIDQLEHERREQIRLGVNPILFGKWHRVQAEFMEKVNHHNILSDVAPAIDKAEKVLSDASGKVLDSSAEIAAEVGSGFSNVLGNISQKVHNLVESAKDTLGIIDPTTTIGITKLEEKERHRRMNEKHEPLMEARKKRFEDELLTTIKLAK